MELLLTNEQALLCESADRICAVTGRARDGMPFDFDGVADQDRKALRTLGDGGYLGLMVAEEQGGSGLGAVELSLLMKQAGRHLVTAPLAESAIAAWAISASANNNLSALWLQELIAGHTLVLPAIDGTAKRYAQVGQQPIVRRRMGELTATGGHSFVVASCPADAFLVAASTDDDEAVIAILKRDDAGVLLETQRSIDGSCTLELRLETAPLPDSSLLATGARAATVLSRLRDLLIIASSAQLLGIAERALEIACAHLKLRKQFGRPLGSYQALQHRAADGFIAIELLNSLQWQVAAAIYENRVHSAMIAALHVKASRTALSVTRAAMQMLGAIGYTAEHAIGWLHRRALLLSALHCGEAGQRAAFARATDLDGRQILGSAT